MNKRIIIAGGIVVIVAIAGVVLLNKLNMNGDDSFATVNQLPPQNPQPASTSSTVPLMQSTVNLFSQYQYFSKAHEIFPTLATDTVKTMGAFGYTKEDLGNNTYRITLTNNAEGYQGQSVVVTAGQSVYFIERSTADDSVSEDAVTGDDMLVAVDAQGFILQ